MTLEEIIKGNLRLNNISKTLIFNHAEWRCVIHVPSGIRLCCCGCAMSTVSTYQSKRAFA